MSQIIADLYPLTFIPMMLLAMGQWSRRRTLNGVFGFACALLIFLLPLVASPFGAEWVQSKPSNFGRILLLGVCAWMMYYILKVNAYSSVPVNESGD